MRIPWAAYANLCLAMAIVGSSVVAGRIMVVNMPVFLASGLRFALALALLAPLMKYTEGGLPKLSRKSLGVMALIALCGSFLFTVCLLYGLTLTSPASAGIITSTTPAAMALIAWLVVGERPTRASVTGIACAVAGVSLVQAGGAAGSGADTLLGGLLVVAAVVFESLFLLLRKKIPEPVSPLGMATMLSFFGLVFFAPFAIYEAAHYDFAAAPPAAWLAVAYYAVFITVLAYLFWFAGIVKVSAQAAGAVTGVMPVSAVALSFLILGEPVRLHHLAGCLLVLAGIVLVSKRPT